MWNILKKAKWSDRRRDGRTPAPDLDASYSTDHEQKQFRVKDISATGLYLLTEDPLQPGTDVELTLQKSILKHEGLLDPMDEEPRAMVHVHGKAVRVGEDGVGVSFEPDSANTGTWTKMVGAVAQLTGETDCVRLFRMSKALAFVAQVSPQAEADMLQIMTTRMSLEQAGRAIDIAVKAEEIAATHQGVLRQDVPARLLLRMLEDGAKVDAEPTRLMWAELLASSCYQGAVDAVNLNFVAMLSRIDAVQMRIFEAACRLALRVGWDPGFKFHEDLHRSAEEIKKISHIQNLMGIERDLNHLFELGLLEQTERPILCQEVDIVNMAPTSLALKLYARCKGQPEPPEQFAGATMQWAS
jgi:hypothetical protein